MSFTFLIFGLLLIWTAVRLFTHRGADPDVAGNPLVRAARHILPVSDSYDGGRLITRTRGRRAVTPLFIVFIAIGGTEMLFALDSIPAVFGITSEAYIVFAPTRSPCSACRTVLPGNRSARPAGLPVRRARGDPGLHRVKLILHWAHGLSTAVPEISTAVSLAVIAVVLTVTTVASLIKSRRDPAARAHPGAVTRTPSAARPDGPGRPAGGSGKTSGPPAHDEPQRRSDPPPR